MGQFCQLKDPDYNGNIIYNKLVTPGDPIVDEHSIELNLMPGEQVFYFLRWHL